MWVILRLITDTNCNLSKSPRTTLTASPPNPLSLRRGGTSHLFLLIFRKYLKQETGEKKVTSVPPLLKERGVGGEAQLQFDIIKRNITHTIRYRAINFLASCFIMSTSELLILISFTMICFAMFRACMVSPFCI